MKRTILILSMMAICAASFAQRGFTFQVIAQPQAKMIMGDFFVPTSTDNYYVPMDKKLGIGFQGGLGFAYGFTDKLSVSLGLLYSNQGQNYDDYFLSQNGESMTLGRKVSLNYVKLPVQLNFLSNPSGNVSFAGFLGFYIAPMLSYKDETTLTGTFYDSQYGYNYTVSSTITAEDQTATVHTSVSYQGVSQADSYNYNISSKPYKADAGITMGAGMSFKLSETIRMPLMLNFQMGLVDIKDRSAIVHNQGDSGPYWNFWADNDGNYSETYANSSFGFMIGLNINLNAAPAKK